MFHEKTFGKTTRDNFEYFHTQIKMEDETAAVPCEPTLSKTQLKKMKKKEKWLMYRGEKRKKEKERRKERRRVAVESGEDLGPSRKSLKLNKMEKSNCRIRIAIDCSFDDYMTDRDHMKLAKQLQTCYSSNRRSPNPLQFYLCSMSGRIREPLQVTGYSNWDVFSRNEKYVDVFDKESIVYLSSDSPNILETLEDDKVYIIGGLVDHNHHKGLCHKIAEENGIKHAQLPIADYVQMKTRKVLAINHVFDILLKFSEIKDWKESFFTAIPQRKGLTAKNDTTDKNADGTADDLASSDTENDETQCEQEGDTTVTQDLKCEINEDKSIQKPYQGNYSESNLENDCAQHFPIKFPNENSEEKPTMDQDVTSKDSIVEETSACS
ncbi:hypothetical protein ScPMuIL_003852 [Solemya velum]